MALLDLTGELTGVLPGLSPILARTYINRSLKSIYGERLWSFLETDGVVVCPGVISTGSASITQYSNSVTMDATASAALVAFVAIGVPNIRQCQIRFSAASPASSQIYSITDYDATVPAAVVLTLDRVVQESTNSTSTYQLFRNLIVPTLPDFLRWVSFVDYANAITLTGNRLTQSSAIFDVRDPQRTANGLAYQLGMWGGNRVDNAVTGNTIPQSLSDSGTPIYELWPVPTSGQTWYVRFRRQGTLLTNPSDTQEPGISDATIVHRVLYEHAYPFAKANVGNFPSMKGVDWNGLISVERAAYIDTLRQDKNDDQERQLGLNDVWNRGHGLRSVRPFGRYDDMQYPIDSNFMQSHLIRF